MNEPISSELFTRVKAGDEDAIRVLVRQFGEDLQMFARHRLTEALRSRIDPADVVQKVWVAFMKSHSFEHFNSSTDLIKYLIGMARNIILQELQRRETKYFHIPANDKFDWNRNNTGEPRAVEDPFREIAARDEYEVLVARLPTHERDIVDLRYHQGLAAVKIAEQTGTHEHAVRRVLENFVANLVALSSSRINQVEYMRRHGSFIPQYVNPNNNINN